LRIARIPVPDKKHLVTLNMMRFSEYGIPPVEVLQKHLEYYRQQNDSADGELRTAQQGVCQYIAQLIELISGASETIEAIEKPANVVNLEFV